MYKFRIFNRLKTCKPVISNNPTDDRRSGGVPVGHPSLNSFLGIPFVSNKRLIGMVGIANRPSGYNKKLIDFLKPFTAACSNLILAIRNEKMELAITRNMAMFRSNHIGSLSLLRILIFIS